MPAEPRIVGFAAVHDVPVPYMQRTREYYLALGFGAPYELAHYAQVPFQPLRKPLSNCPPGDRHDGRSVQAIRQAIRVQGRPTMRPRSSMPSIR